MGRTRAEAVVNKEALAQLGLYQSSAADIVSLLEAWVPGKAHSCDADSLEDSRMQQVGIASNLIAIAVEILGEVLFDSKSTNGGNDEERKR